MSPITLKEQQQLVRFAARVISEWWDESELDGGWVEELAGECGVTKDLANRALLARVEPAVPVSALRRQLADRRSYQQRFTAAPRAGVPVEAELRRGLDAVWDCAEGRRPCPGRTKHVKDAVERLVALCGVPVEALDPVYQRDGDGMCLPACVSSLTDIPFDAWPALGPKTNTTDFWDTIFAVMHVRGWELARSGIAPAGYSIADGDGPRGLRHSVVVLDGKLAHDPHPSGGGLVGRPVCYWTPVRAVLVAAQPEQPDA